MVKISIEANEKEQRLDRFLKKYLSKAPLSFVYKAIRKDVKVNGRRQKQDYMLQEGDEISLYIPDEELARYHPPRLLYGGGACAGGWPGSEPGSQAGVRSRARKQFSVAYEDEHLLIVNKPPGLLTHGDRKEKTNHLTNQVIAYLIGEGSYDPREKTFVPAPVNRLDRNTAGLVIFPKTYDALKAMNQVIHDHRCIRKFYLTIVAGQLEEPLHLEGSMSRDELRNMTMVGDEGKYMETMVEPLQKARGFTLCRVEIRTGRTHQIRAQMADAGYPLAGDAKYGDPKVNKALSNRFGLTSQLLVARELIFSDMPQGYEYLNGKTVTARLPRKFTEMMGALGLQEG